jgi:hypothetical protein
MIIIKIIFKKYKIKVIKINCKLSQKFKFIILFVNENLILNLVSNIFIIFKS